MQVMQLKRQEDLRQYASNYMHITNTEIPFDYLTNNLVYGFIKDKKLVAGFIVGITPPFRTIELFAPPSSHSELMAFLNSGKEVCEVCCFWQIRSEITFADNAFIWFSMSQKVRVKGKQFFLGGTYAKGLANLYGYPTYAHLISKGEVNGKQAWIFIAWRKYAVLSAIEVMIYKLRKSINKKSNRPLPDCTKYDEKALFKVAKALNTDYTKNILQAQI